MIGLAILLCTLFAAPACGSLTAAVFPNVAFAPASSSQSTTVPAATLSGLSIPDYTSVRFTGTVTPSNTDAALNFSAVSEGGVRLWVDDFLIIDAGGLHNSSAGGGTPSRLAIQTIPVSAGTPLAFRLEYSRWSSGTTGAPTLALYWQGGSTPYAAIPPSAYGPTSAPEQIAMADLRDRLAAPSVCAWQTHYRRSATAHTLAPTGLVLLAGLVDIISGSVLSDIFVQRGGSSYVSRAGMHSRNGSDYTLFNIWAWNGHTCNVSLETTVTDGQTKPAQSQLQFLATAEGVDCWRMRLLVQPTLFDERVGFPSSASSGGFIIDLPGFPTVAVSPAGGTPVPLNASVAPPSGVPYFALSLASVGDGGPAVVGYCAQSVSASDARGSGMQAPLVCPAAAEMAGNIAAARVRAASASAVYGNLSDVYEGIATSILWNTVFAVQEGTIAIVSRNPNWAGNSEFVADYVLFEWDSYFIAAQAAIEDGMLRDIGVSTLVQVTLARTPKGFVPNWKSGSHSSYDRTENQVGAFIALRILDMLPPSTRTWVLSLLFPPLLTWHEWVWSSRMALGGVYQGLPLMILGSDPSTPHDNGDGNMQGARYESMDNSPAYDAPPVAFNGTTHQIMQYDVSPTALFLSDTEALITLAVEAGRVNVIPLLQAHFNATAAALNSVLWLPELGTFANRLFNGTFNARLTPPSFYPLLSGVVPDAQAAALAALLTSPTGFCVNASHTPGMPPTLTGLLTRWSSKATGHSVGCVTQACTDQALLYGKATFDGVEASVPLVGEDVSEGPTGAVPLYQYTSQSNSTALATAPPDATFTILRQEGWCFPLGTAPAGDEFRSWPLTNLSLWVLTNKEKVPLDYRTCGSVACESSAAAGGYATSSALMCIAFDASTPATLPCTVPVPSLARGDANFYDQNYWRGRAWGPQVLLVYYALKRYEHVPELQAAIADLVSLGKSTMLAEWLSFGHIAENLSGLTGFSQDSGDADPFYAWGGCFGLPAMLEAGFPYNVSRT